MEIEHMRHTSHSHQLDWRWVERFRELDAFDAYWWWAQAGPFNEEEQQQWDQLLTPNIDEATKSELGTLIAQSRERELTTALAEKCEPRLWYPALPIGEVRNRLAALEQLDTEIRQEEPNAIVRRLYHDAIENEISFLRLFEATSEGRNEHFWKFSQAVYPQPTCEEMSYVLSRVWEVIQQGLQDPVATEVSQQLLAFMHEELHLSHNVSSGILDIQKSLHHSSPSSQAQKMVTAQTARRFFETVLRENGYEDWQVVIDKASTTRVESGLRQLIIADTPTSVERVRHYFIHELGGHIARSIAGERSPLGLLAIGTKNYSPTEEGLALYHERQIAVRQGQSLSDWGTLLGTLSTGLASGVMTPPQTFLALFNFLESFFLLRRLLNRQDKDASTARKYARKVALANCLRTYRGVPNLEQSGVCLTKDVVYLRGLWMIERAVARDETVLDRLAVGKVALEYLPDLQELGIVVASQPLTKLVNNPDLDAYIFSFEEQPEKTDTQP